MKYIALTTLILLMLMFASPIVNAKSPIEVSYTSVVTSMTKIQLNLYENGKFVLLINIFGDKIPTTKSYGSWFKKDGYYVLTFKKRRSPTLKALFPNISVNNSVEIISDDTFRFKVDAIELLIYGIKCKKGSFTRV